MATLHKSHMCNRTDLLAVSSKPPWPYNHAGLKAIVAVHNTRAVVFEALQSQKLFLNGGDGLLLHVVISYKSPLSIFSAYHAWQSWMRIHRAALFRVYSILHAKFGASSRQWTWAQILVHLVGLSLNPHLSLSENAYQFCTLKPKIKST